MTDAERKDLKRRKFEWLARVMEDRRISEVRRLVLVYSCLQFERQLTFCIRQATVAQRLGVHRDTVSDALRQARELGWLELVRERQRGRGYTKGNELRLTFPAEIGGPASAYSSQEYADQGAQIGGPGSAEYADDPTLLAAEMHSYQVYPGNTSRCASRAGAPEATRPSPFCPKHMPDGTTDDCRGCLRARQRCERWDAEQERAAAEAAAVARALRENPPADEPPPEALYGRCDVHLCALDADGTCPRCRLVSGDWKRSGGGTGQAAAQ